MEWNRSSCVRRRVSGTGLAVPEATSGVAQQVCHLTLNAVTARKRQSRAVLLPGSVARAAHTDYFCSFFDTLRSIHTDMSLSACLSACAMRVAVTCRTLFLALLFLIHPLILYYPPPYLTARSLPRSQHPPRAPHSPGLKIAVGGTGSSGRPRARVRPPRPLPQKPHGRRDHERPDNERVKQDRDD